MSSVPASITVSASIAARRAVAIMAPRIWPRAQGTLAVMASRAPITRLPSS
jgi:hypothetical protein